MSTVAEHVPVDAPPEPITWDAGDGSDAKPPRPEAGAPNPAFRPPKFSEMEKRRSGYVGGAPIVLLDGQTWFFPRPLARFGFSDDDGFSMFLSMEDGDKYADMMQAYQDEQDPVRQMGLRLKLIRYMVGINYDLSTTELNHIMQFSFDEDDIEASRIRREVWAVATGNAPKPDGGGSDSPLSIEPVPDSGT